MMKLKNKTQMNRFSGESRPLDWELRPGGMLVQRRNSDSDQETTPSPMIRVRVKYGSIYHEISINSQATFGELKKMLVGVIGLHHQDQKVMFKKKERDSKAFLDVCGVRDKSKMVVVEDAVSQERRFLEMRKNSRIEKASKSISEISLEVDRLAGQVSTMEDVISKSGKVAEENVLSLIELLMNELLKLDAIMGEGDVKFQRKMQVKRVQKYVETLDKLKIKNSMSSQRNSRSSNGGLSTIQEEQLSAKKTGSGTVVTTKWETFEPSPAKAAAASSTSSSSSSSTEQSVQPKLNWEFFE